MKRIIFSLAMAFCSLMAGAQSTEKEIAYPSHGVTLSRRVSHAMIDEQFHKDVDYTVELKAAEAGGDKNFWRDGDVLPPLQGVKVTVKDNKTGKKIYKKRFSQAYLYVFPSAGVHVGKGNRGVNVVNYLCIENSPVGWIVTIDENGIIF